jgi:hypothetical protein
MAGDLTGRTIGGYQIVEQLGRGGMATVYKAYQPSLERHVAIKVLPEYFQHDPTFAERFAREAKAVAQLDHPNILPVYDYGEEGGITYLVMKYVEGGTLKARLQTDLPSLGETARIIRQVADALDYAHAQGMIHRDVKPANVLLTSPDWALLSDFGIAKVTGATQQLTGTGVGVGTPEYMAPEQGQGAADVDARADVYSLGVMLYEMTTGQLPYTADTPMGVIIKHIQAPLPLPRKVRPDLPEAIERVILKAMAKSPTDRYQSAGALAGALEAAVRQVEGLGPSAPTVSAPLPGAAAIPPAPAVAERRRPPWLWIGLGAAALMLVCTGVVVAVGGGLIGPLVGAPAETAPPAEALPAIPAAGESPQAPAVEPTAAEEPAPAVEPTAPASGPQIIYEDDFDTMRDLPNEQGMEESMYYIDGQYEMKYTLWGGIDLATSTATVPGITAEKFVAEFDAQLTANAENGAVGFTFGDRPDATLFNVLLTTNGELLVRSWDPVTEEGRTLIDWLPSTAINRGYVPNHVKLVVDGDTLAIYANGDLAATTDLPGYQGGQFGPSMMAYWQPGDDADTSFDVIARFDNLMVTTYAPETGAGGEEPTGTVAGKMCYPSSGIPPMTIYAENVETGELLEKSHAGDLQYTFSGIPPGEYYFYAYTVGGGTIPEGIGGGYTVAVPCGLSVDCEDHTMLPVRVEPGGSVTGIDICDWYSQDTIPPNPQER